MNTWPTLGLGILLLLTLQSCGMANTGSSATDAPATRPVSESSSTSQSPIAPTPTIVPFRLTSASFRDGQPIPVQSTCDGDDSSPALSWSGTPAKTRSLVLLLRDPDANNYSHWVVYNLPPTTTSLEADQARDQQLLAGGSQGKNDNRQFGYGGPCPPKGKPHRYVFTLYALDTVLNLEERILKLGAPMLAIEIAMKDHVLAETQLTGTYQR